MFRPASTSDLDLLLSARTTDPVGIIDADRYRRELELHQYRPEWSWIHAVNGRLVARALWWGQPKSAYPVSLDCLWIDPSIAAPGTLAGRLVEAGHSAFRASGINRLPDLNMDVPPNWHDDPLAVAAVKWRQDAVTSAGLTERIERLSYAWAGTKPTPKRSDMLTFTPADDRAFLEIFSEVAQGSLDIHTQTDLAELGPAGQAADDLEFYLGLPGDRQMWRIAHNLIGERVGFIIPSRSAYDASVSYLGVVPDHRGHGFVDDLLAEITIMHRDNGAPRITGTTDTTNAPMAAAFRRAGYEVTAVRIVFGPHPANILGTAGCGSVNATRVHR